VRELSAEDRPDEDRKLSFPTIDLGDVRVTPFERRHLTERYVSWLNDPEVVRYSEQRHRRHSLESCTRYFQDMSASSDHFLAIEAHDRALGHIGNARVSVDSANRVADISILIGEKRAWNLGFGSRVWDAILHELLLNQDIRKVTAGTMSVNTPMLRLMAKSGMRVEATRPRHFLWDGEEVDLIQAALFREDLAPVPENA
jgi:RimJ/RimL family protein N-acetyltransferase